MAEYQLWDVDAGSYIGKYGDEHDALATVQKLVDHFGPDYAESLSLGRIADDGQILPAISGDELRVLAFNAIKGGEERKSTVIGSTIGRIPDGVGMAAKAGHRAVRRVTMGRPAPMAPKRDRQSWDKKSH